MRNWQTPLVTLKANRNDIGKGTLDLECDNVAHEGSGKCYLTISRVNPQPLQEIDWTPQFVTFASVGAVSPTEFEVSNYEIVDNGASVRLTIA